MHPDLDATFVCTRCGTFACEGCQFTAVTGREVCDACASQGLGAPIPWERRKELGNWAAFWKTVRLASRSPTAFFRTPSTTDSVVPAMAHGVLTFTVGLMLSYLMAGVLVMIGGGATALVMDDETGETIGALLGAYGCFIAGLSPVALLFGPANALMGLVTAAAASHGVLALFKKTRGGFEDTLRAVCYANSPYVWSWVPVLGSVTWFWMIGLEVVALREVHKCGSDWAAVAAIGYRVVLLTGLFVGYLLMGGLVYAMMMQRELG